MKSFDLLSPNQVITRLDIPSTTLYRWIAEGRFPKPVKIGPRRTAFRVSHIEAWLNEREESEREVEVG